MANSPQHSTSKSDTPVKREKLYPRISDTLYYSNQPALEFIRSFANNLSKTTTVVDLGCGTKPYQPLFSHCAQYVGTDITKTGTRADIICPNWKLDIPDHSFDCAISTFVLEHTLHVKESLKEMRRVVKPGGTLCLIVPFVFPEHESPHDYWRFTRYAMKELCAEMHIETIQPSGGALKTLAVLYNIFIQSTIPIPFIVRLSNAIVNSVVFIVDRIIVLSLLRSYSPEVAYQRSYHGIPLNYFVVLKNNSQK